MHSVNGGEIAGRALDSDKQEERSDDGEGDIVGAGGMASFLARNTA